MTISEVQGLDLTNNEFVTRFMAEVVKRKGKQYTIQQVAVTFHQFLSAFLLEELIAYYANANATQRGIRYDFDLALKADKNRRYSQQGGLNELLGGDDAPTPERLEQPWLGFRYLLQVPTTDRELWRPRIEYFLRLLILLSECPEEEVTKRLVAVIPQAK
jgi:hypothetical protein